jgi:N-acetylneuraminic acid mutarotase
LSTSSSVSTFPAWTNATPIPNPREGYGAAEVKGIFYYIAGYGVIGDMTLNEAYNASSNTWTTKASLPSLPRSETVAVTDGTYIYLIGGRPVPTVGHDLWRYNPTDNTWTSLTPMPTARATEHMAVYYNGRIYVAGGRTSGVPSSSGDLAVLEIYDIASNTWSSGTSMPQPLADSYAVLLNGRIYVFGGFTLGGAASSSTFIYDISADAWSTGAPAPSGRVDPAVGICGPLIYMIGGGNAFLQLQTSNYAYNPLIDNWTSSLPIPIPTAEAQAISYNNQIFVVSGGIFGSGGGNPASQVFHCSGNTLYVSPTSQPAQPVGTSVSYRIKVANMQPFNGWDVSVSSNQSVINPVSISITGNIFQANFSATVNVVANCVNGQGTGCLPTDGPGIAHSAAAILGQPSLPANSTLKGLLFTITYTAAAGKFSPVTIFRDTLKNGTTTPVPHTAISGVYGTPPPDFGLSAFPAHVFIGQGSSATSAIIVQSLHSFAGNVSLSVAISPSGPTWSFSQNPVSISANQTRVSKVTISASAATLLGNYTLIVTGKTGSLSHSFMLSVTVLPDFSIAANPDSFTILPGARISSTIALMSKGFAGTISLSAFTNPAVLYGPQLFLNASFVTLSAGGSLQAFLGISTFVVTPPGNYTITVSATAGFLSHSATITLDVLPPQLTLTPSKGPIGTKVLVQGSNFPFYRGTSFPDTIFVTFDDVLLGTTQLSNDTFTFVLDVPQAQVGSHMIKAHDYNTFAFAQASFLVTTPQNLLSLTLQVGTIYFPGDSAVISVLATQASVVAPSGLQLQIFLIRPDGSNTTLIPTQVAAGLFRTSYVIPKTGPLGTYAILAKATLSGQQTSALQTFEVKLSWLSSNAGNITSAVTVAGVLGLVGVAWKKGLLKGKRGEETPSFF